MPELLISELADDPDLSDLIDLFVSELPLRIAAIREAAAAGDGAMLTRLAHQLKGAAGGYGYPAISDAAADVEHGAGSARAHHVSRLAMLCRAAWAARAARAS